MREAFELAWANAYILSGKHPFFLALDDISFHRPVDIGSILHLQSKIAFASGLNMKAKIKKERKMMMIMTITKP